MDIAGNNWLKKSWKYISDDKEGVVKENSSKWKLKKSGSFVCNINRGNEMELTQACKVYN